MRPLKAGYLAIYVSDRRCTIGQIYQARLLDLDSTVRIRQRRPRGVLGLRNLMRIVTRDRDAIMLCTPLGRLDPLHQVLRFDLTHGLAVRPMKDSRLRIAGPHGFDNLAWPTSLTSYWPTSLA